MNKTYEVCFNIHKPVFYILPGWVRESMQNELLRVYDTYANRTNSGVTELLNDKFNALNPTYFKDNADKEWYDMAEYNKFMADGYQYLVVDELNKRNISSVLDFYVDPAEVAFKGRLKWNRKVTIEFYLKEA
jgi:hypothetical protein